MPNYSATVLDYSKYKDQLQPVTDLKSIITSIQDGCYEPIILNLRKIVDKSEYAAKKRWQLPAFFAGCTFKQTLLPGYRSNCIIPNFELNEGISVLDFDGLAASDISNLISIFKDRPSTVFQFLSPSGSGIKVGVAHQSTNELDVLRLIKKSIRISESVDALVDKASINNPLLKCFVSSDTSAWYNDNVQPLEVEIIQPEQRSSVRTSYAACNATWDDAQLFLNEIAPYVIIQEYSDYLTAGLVLAKYVREDLWYQINDNNASNYYRCSDHVEAMRSFKQYLMSNHQRVTSGLPLQGIPSLYALTMGHSASFKQINDFAVSLTRKPGANNANSN